MDNGACSYRRFRDSGDESGLDEIIREYRDGLTLRAIADQTGRHINTIYKHHRAALQKLRGTLQPYRE